ncbi:MAG: response regulator transcription factor [Erysipelotrichaceae bacterium]|nr:response regulator transcription factor [Erysipelotrichaceae bacterium]
MTLSIHQKKLIKLYPHEQSNNYDLTIKEKEVLKCIIKGYTNKDISEELVISLSTVKTHVSNIYSKLGVKNRSQAIRIAKENNIIN